MLHHLLMTMSRGQKGLILLAMDAVLLVVVTLVSAWSVQLWHGSFALGGLFLPLVTMLVTTAILLFLRDIHKVPLNAYDDRTVLQTSAVACGSAIAGAAIAHIWHTDLPVFLFAMAAMGFVISSIISRVLLREIVTAIYRNQSGVVRILIYGAGCTGQQLAAALATDRNVQCVGFIDDNPALLGVSISGLRVYSGQRLQDRVNDLGVDRIVLAMKDENSTARDALAKRLSMLSCEVHAIPSFARLVTSRGRLPATEPVDFGRLLGRAQVDAVLPEMADMYRGKVVLVTGAGGSIGSEICRQVAGCDPSLIVLLDHSEVALYSIGREMVERFPDTCAIAVLGSVCTPTLIEHTLKTHKVDVVLHAAAYKQLPMLEGNIVEAMRNNVLGTQIVAQAAERCAVDSFILISTDKAVRPTSWLGYSKRVAEMLVQDLANRSTSTRFSMVRFGNVLGSAGSVVPLFREQIARGGPVTVTHPDVKRYFMTVSEAVRLVMLAGSYARGGDVFVLDMGAPVRILDMARSLIEASGERVRESRHSCEGIEIRITGLTAGEKLSEELLIGQDMLATPHPKILRAHEEHPSELEMATILRDITRCVEAHDVDRLTEMPDKWARYLDRDVKPVPTRGAIRAAKA